MALTFEWDEEKAKRNVSKHGITFEEGKTIFNDPFAVTIGDPDISEGETRYLDIGLSYRGRIMVVWYTEREHKIRIIGCRKATRSERRNYEEKPRER